MWKTVKAFVGLRAKTCRYLMDEGSEDKLQKTPKSVS